MRDQASRLRQLLSGEEARIPDSLPGHGKARVIGVTSGKGGVGKTTLSVNLGIVLADMNYRVLVLDADLGLANVDVMLGMETGRHIGHLLLGNCAPDDVAVTGPGGIRVISGGSGLRELAEAGGAERRMLLEKLCGYFEDFDFVLVDTSPGISADVLDFLRIADEVLLVTTVEPTSVRDSYAALKAITAQLREKPVTPVVNLATTGQAEKVVQVLDQVAEKFLAWRCVSSHNIVTDPVVPRAIQDRKPLVRTFPKSPASVCIRQLAKKLTFRGPEIADGKEQYVPA